jgi:tetratricopeptide (TPR) repeat protein
LPGTILSRRKIAGCSCNGSATFPPLISAFDSAVQIAPGEPHLRRVHADARLASGDLEGALHDLNHAILVQPNSSNQYRVRADVYKRLRRQEPAENDLATAAQFNIQRYPATDIPFLDLGEIFQYSRVLGE